LRKGNSKHQAPMEPHAGKRFGRLHLILGDANMSEVSAFLKFGTTGIVLEMIEAGFLKEVPVLENQVAALQEISNDPTCKKLVRLENGQRMTAVNLQKWYYIKAEKYFERVSPNKEQKMVMKEWIDKLDKLFRDPRECDQELDWAIKNRLCETYRAKKGLSLGDEEVRIVAWLYHHLDPEIGLYYKLLRDGKMRRLVTDEEIKRAMKNPPKNTRAFLRGKIIKAILSHPAYRKAVLVNWGQISYWSAISLDWVPIVIEPFDTENERVKELIERINEGSRLIVRKNLF